ncbi:Beta-1 adrenergic receptor [Trichoplax sp. H2]|uniref:G-protein coupled receptors family 1 profile domain-containing protein n=1 Tax=Trichoplax adhaerens TaxID=10228 RepID=B3RKG0_TRIAD|nr:hypothetical protein TRIADDRAFT_51667 [Trichoplax adhaerens]EDV28591.1 hypothetical protein TRIADDRAFT_51667 [Trichoplax adhaerens]RDD40420.1 Beta-1 adrenergic receptor [Trichoplax sp. H2]|eukprot:XP_002107793.1 hypothetical protein TRIADDRAFT_51667 [Trichoplax adhaerens]
MSKFEGYNLTNHFTTTSSSLAANSSILPFTWSLHYNIPILTLFFSIVMIFAVTGNLFSLITIYRSVSLHTINNMFIFNLAVVDLLSSLLVIPLGLAVVSSQSHFSNTLCQIQGFLLMFLNTTSLMTTTLISIDRVIAVTKPYYYAAIAKFHAMIALIAGIWILSILFATLPLLHLQHYGFGYYTLVYICWINIHDYDANFVIAIAAICLILFSMMAIIISYTIIFCIACNKVANQLRPNGYGDVMKSVRTTAIIVGTNLLFWLPFVTACIIEIKDGHYHRRDPDFDETLFKVAYLAPFGSAASNPIIYITTNGVLRLKFQKLFQFKTSLQPLRKRTAISPSRRNNSTAACIVEQINSLNDSYRPDDENQ